MTSFEKWVGTNPDHKYTDTTIKRYTRALDKVEEWLNISLPIKVLDITDYQTFLQMKIG